MPTPDAPDAGYPQPPTEAAPSQEEIRRGLRQAGGRKPAPPPVERRHKLALAAYGATLIALAVILYLLRFRPPGLLAPYLLIAQRLTRGVMFALLVLAIAKAARVFLIDRMDDDVSRYNLRRIVRLVATLIIAFIAISVIFRNWYAAVVSLGLLSLVLGFALQTPITSFIGWIYILAREPYRVGDRIQIGDTTGDVLDVGYLDTTLWEFGGPYVSTDHPSGRLIKFPNANVLTSAVYNYSWPLFPYIWNEIAVQVGYDSNLAFVTGTMREVVTEELGPAMVERVEQVRALLANTPVDRLTIREHPVVMVRVSQNTWLEPFVRYLVDPKRAGELRSRLTAEIIGRLRAAPDKVRFPKGDSR